MNQLELFVYGGCHTEVKESKHACDYVGYFTFRGVQEGRNMYLVLYDCPQCQSTKSYTSITEDITWPNIYNNS